MSTALDERHREAVASLGPIPTSVTRLLTVASSPDFDLGDIVDVVAHDMVLAGAVLRVANSAASSPSQQIHTVREAVMRIGTVQTITVGMHTAVDSALAMDLELYGLSATELWTHASAASIAAGEIRRYAQLSLPPSTPTTALLHDLGKVVFARVAVDEYTGGAVSLQGCSSEELCDRERQLFGIDHAEMGAMTAELWNLPPAIVEGIAGHHLLIDDPLPAAIGLADRIAHVACQPTSDVETIESDGSARSAASVLGIPLDRLASIIDTTRSQLTDAAARLATGPR